MGTKKKEALIQFHRGNIIAAAKKLFEEKGVEATRMDDIAKEADYSKSTVYVYFKNKEEIVNVILLEQGTMLKEMLERCVHKKDDFITTYQTICKEMTLFQQQYPVCYDMMFGEILITKEDFEQKNYIYDIYVVGEEINNLIGEYLKRGIEEGVVKSDLDILPTVFFFWSGISEIIRFSSKKEAYMKMRLNMERQEYLNYSFDLLLKSILK